LLHMAGMSIACTLLRRNGDGTAHASFAPGTLSTEALATLATQQRGKAA